MVMNSEPYLVVAGYLILESDNINNPIANLQIDIGGFTIEGSTLSVYCVAARFELALLCVCKWGLGFYSLLLVSLVECYC